jgi:hypothetical protein
MSSKVISPSRRLSEFSMIVESNKCARFKKIRDQTIESIKKQETEI